MKTETETDQDPRKRFNDMIDFDRLNLWRYAKFYEPYIPPQFQLTLEEGWTKIVNVDLSGFGHLFLKREDLNPTGSQKARGLAYQISLAYAQGTKKLLIPSSGNAAIAAAAYCALCGISLYVFLSSHTKPEKVHPILRFGGRVVMTEKAINFARHASRRLNIPNLRPSLDPCAPVGYQSLAFEIFEQCGANVDALFGFATSGTTLLGVYQGFQRLKHLGVIRKIPQIHAVQAGRSAGLAEEFSNEEIVTEDGPAGALGVRHSPRSKALLEAIEQTQGAVWYVYHDEIESARSFLCAKGIDTSAEGCAAVAAALKCKPLPQKTVCLLTGHESQWPKDPANLKNIRHLFTYRELDDLERNLTF